MQNLVEIQKEVAGDIEVGMVDETYCADLYDKGNLISGYALWLAKEVVHKDSNTGWKKFCDKIGTAPREANRQIEFYDAKSGAIALDSLPSKEGTFRALPSGTNEEKVEFYADVKELSGKDEPTAQDITITKKIKGAYKTEVKAKKDIEIVLKKATPKIKAKLDKRIGQKGIASIIKSIDNGVKEETILEMFDNAPKPLPSKVADANKELRTRNKKLEEDMRKIQLKLDDYDMVKEFTNAMRFLAVKLAAIDHEKMLKSVAFDNMKPTLKKALEFMEFDIHDLDNVTKETLKKKYRKMAMTMHPDKKLTGSNDLFLELQEAQKLIHKMLEGTQK